MVFSFSRKDFIMWYFCRKNVNNDDLLRDGKIFFHPIHLNAKFLLYTFRKSINSQVLKGTQRDNKKEILKTCWAYYSNGLSINFKLKISCKSSTKDGHLFNKIISPQRSQKIQVLT